MVEFRAPTWAPILPIGELSFPLIHFGVKRSPRRRLWAASRSREVSDASAVGRVRYADTFGALCALPRWRETTPIPTWAQGRSLRLSVQQGGIETRRRAVGLDQASGDIAYLDRILDDPDDFSSVAQQLAGFVPSDHGTAPCVRANAVESPISCDPLLRFLSVRRVQPVAARSLLLSVSIRSRLIAQPRRRPASLG